MLQMVTDPSWFYSSLAQSAAAVIGLMGALFLSRLLQRMGEVAESRSRLLEEFKSVRQGMRNIKVQFVQPYAEWIDASLPGAEEAVRAGRPLTMGRMRSFNSDVSGQWPVDAAMVDGWRTDREDCDQLVALLDGAAAVTDIHGLDPLIRALRAFVGEHDGRRSAQVAQDWLRPLERLARLSDIHHTQVLPRSAWTMLAILAFLGAVGVIAPLGFLIVGSVSTPQKLLLSGFAVGLFGLLVYLGLTMRDLREAGHLQLAPRDMPDDALVPGAATSQPTLRARLADLGRVAATTMRRRVATALRLRADRRS